MDIQILEPNSKTTKVIALSRNGKEFLKGKKIKFMGAYRWQNANEIGYDAENLGLKVFWLA